MSQNTPTITALKPLVLADNRRVTMEMEVAGLPGVDPGGIPLTIPGEAPPPKEADPPYPNIELRIIDSSDTTVAELLIVEHKEPTTSLTLHLRQPDPAEHYIARAEMTYDEEILQIVEVPFTLNT